MSKLVDPGKPDELEALAYAEYGKLLYSALLVRRLFDAAGAPYPPPLARLCNAEQSLVRDPRESPGGSVPR